MAALIHSRRFICFLIIDIKYAVTLYQTLFFNIKHAAYHPGQGVNYICKYRKDFKQNYLHSWSWLL